MAEYSVVIREAKRMCWHYTQGGNHDKCPMYPACNVSQCRKIAFERPADFEARVMQWAAEHPEPVYPTWGEWLLSVGAAKKIPTGIPYQLADGHIVEPSWEIVVLTGERIPNDTAEKLGIEPKEAKA